LLWQAGGGEADEHIAGNNGPSVDNGIALRHAHDKTGQVVLPGRVEAGHLRRLPAQKSAAGDAAAAGQARYHLLHLRGVQLPHGQVIEEEKRLRALDQDVIHAHGHAVFAHRVMPAQGKGHLQLRPHAVASGEQHRPAVSFRF